MEKLISAGELAERYGCSRNTAISYMRQMEHMEKPLRVRESVLRLWELERTRQAGEKYEVPKRRKKPILLYPRRMEPENGKHIVSRIRPENAGEAWDRIIKAL